MSLDRLESLSEEQCFELLRSGFLGRVGFSLGGTPVVLPVNYALLDRDVVFRSAPGTKLSAAVLGTRVAFEVDDADALYRAGWSVLVIGHADEIRDEETLAAVRQLPLRPWAGGERDHYVRVESEHVSGRRLGAGSA